ncbi:MAG TPA: MMPL family transporter [Pirellulales bacterium]|nr:MMPL family transporter [Pirellulales bacterium]
MFFERYSKIILGAAILVLPVLAYGAIRAAGTNRNDVKDWLPETFQETQDYHWFQKHFENETQVLVSWPGATLEDPRVEKFARLVDARRSGTDGPIDTALFSTVLTGPEVVERLTRAPVNLTRAEAAARLAGVLVGKDHRQVSAVVSLSPKGQVDLHDTLAQLEKAAEMATGLSARDIYMGGPPVDNVAIDDESAGTLRYLAGLSALTGLGLAYWCMRQWGLTVLICTAAVYSALVALAMVYFTGNMMDAIMYSMPPVVYTAALSGAIHIINYYRATVGEGGRAGAAGRALRRAWLPCMLSAMTTAIGLGSLCISELVPIRLFGFYSCLGVLCTLALLFTCVPAALQLWPPRPVAPPAIHPWDEPTDGRWFHRLGLKLAWGIVGHHALVILAFATTLVGLGIGARYVKTSVSIANLFSPEAELVRKYEWLQEHLGGLIPMEVIIRFDNRENQQSFLERLTLVDRIERHLVALPEVSSSMSPVTFAPSLDQPVSSGGRGASKAMQRLLVRNPERVRQDVLNKQLLKSRAEFESSDYLSRDTADGNDEEEWRISLRLLADEDVDYGLFVHEIERQVEPFLDAANDPDVRGASALYTGVTPVVYKAERALLNGLIESFFTAFLIMAAVMAIVYRSVLAGLLVMFPNVWPMAVVFGYLGYAGAVIDIGTMMTASVAMGVSVDDAAHYLTWFRFGIGRGYDRKTAAVFAYRNAAVAMAQSSIIVGLGLAVFGFSSFVPTKMFGLLMLLLLAWGLFADLVLLPAIVAGPLGRFFTRGVRPDIVHRPDEVSGGGELVGAGAIADKSATQ